MGQIQRSCQAKVQELRDHYEGEVLEQMRASTERKVDHLQSELNKLRDENQRLSHQNQELTTTNDTLQQDMIKLQNEQQIEKDQIQAELKQCKD